MYRKMAIPLSCSVSQFLSIQSHINSFVLTLDFIFRVPLPDVDDLYPLMMRNKIPLPFPFFIRGGCKEVIVTIQ